MADGLEVDTAPAGQAASGADLPASMAALHARYGFHRPQELLAHPAFATARTHYVTQIMGLYDYAPSMNRVLIEAGRHIMFGIIACLHAQYDEADRASWLTVKRLKEELGAFGLVSSRSVDSILVRLAETGFLTLRPAPTDRRLRLIEPTERLNTHNLAVITAHIRPLQVLFSESRYEAFLRHDPAFLQAQRMAAVSSFSWLAQILTGNAEMMHFLPRPSGIQILFKFVELDIGRSDPSVRGQTFAEIGHRFGVSRSHVRNLVIESERAGLLERTSPGEYGVRLTPLCAAAFDRFVAETLSLSDLAGCMAEAHLNNIAAASAPAASAPLAFAV